MLAATTAFGKTVVAASLLAARKANTLVLVHRRQLMDQWVARLGAFLDLPASAIGRIGDGRRKPTGVVDVAVIQSLVRGNAVDDIVAHYGHLIVDECHHLSAVSFEKVARRAKIRYVLGLSATVTRQDGHHPIVFMQCGPVRFRASAKSLARQRPFAHRALLRPTAFRAARGHRTVRSKGCLSNKTALAMVFKLAQSAQNSWRRLDGHNQLPKLIVGVKFIDGIEAVRQQPQAAA